MTDKHKDDALLEDAFAALRAETARRDAPRPDAALVARVLADADRIAAQRRRAAPVAPRPRGEVFAALRDLARALGGWPSLAGLVAAGIVGVWIGVDPPGVLAEAARTLWPEEAVSLIDIDPAAAFEIDEEAS